MKIDLTKFERSLMYASEAFGIYQPLLGWRSKREVERITRGLDASFSPVAKASMASLSPGLQFDHSQIRSPQLQEILIGSPEPHSAAYVNADINRFVTRAILARVVSTGPDAHG